jgi:hypothetical protein
VEGNNKKIVMDRYGFFLGNFRLPIPLGPLSFAFPTQCKQVFFSNDETWNSKRGGDWKVIIGSEVRGRRVAQDNRTPDIEILKPGRDADYEGLHGL